MGNFIHKEGNKKIFFYEWECHELTNVINAKFMESFNDCQIRSLQTSQCHKISGISNFELFLFDSEKMRIEMKWKILDNCFSAFF